jgi:hypothetical protein
MPKATPPSVHHGQGNGKLLLSLLLSISQMLGGGGKEEAAKAMQK